MTYADFTATLAAPAPPPQLPPLLLALWHDYHHDWEAAHNIAQADDADPRYARLHAYLHRREGDDWNAGYWYRRARQARFAGSLREEWEALARAFSENK